MYIQVREVIRGRFTATRFYVINYACWLERSASFAKTHQPGNACIVGEKGLVDMLSYRLRAAQVTQYEQLGKSNH